MRAARKGTVDVIVAAKTDSQIDPGDLVQIRRDFGKPDWLRHARDCNRRRNAVDVGNAAGAKHLSGELARRPNLVRYRQHAPHIGERVLRARYFASGQLVKFPDDPGNVPDPLEQADPLGGLEDQVTRGLVEECARNRRGIDLGSRNIVELDVETAQRRLEFTPCDLVRIMLPTEYEGGPALLPDCRAEKDLYPLHPSLRIRVSIDGPF